MTSHFGWVFYFAEEAKNNVRLVADIFIPKQENTPHEAGWCPLEDEMIEQADGDHEDHDVADEAEQEAADLCIPNLDAEWLLLHAGVVCGLVPSALGRPLFGAGHLLRPRVVEHGLGVVGFGGGILSGALRRRNAGGHAKLVVALLECITLGGRMVGPGEVVFGAHGQCGVTRGRSAATQGRIGVPVPLVLRTARSLTREGHVTAPIV
jgi:hypothetical protein